MPLQRPISGRSANYSSGRVIGGVIGLFIVLLVIGLSSNSSQDANKPVGAGVVAEPHKAGLVLSTQEATWLKLVVHQDITAFANGGRSVFGQEGLGVMPVSAGELARAYEQNEVAADNRFKGKELLVTGRVASIDKDFMDEPVLRLVGLDMFNSVMADMSRNELQYLSLLEKGETAHLVCRGGGRLIGDAVLRKCISAAKELDARAMAQVNDFLRGKRKDSFSLFAVVGGAIYQADHINAQSICWKDPDNTKCRKEIDKIQLGRASLDSDFENVLGRLIKAGLISKEAYELGIGADKVRVVSPSASAS